MPIAPPLPQVYDWLKKHDSEARKIADTAQEFAWSHLHKESRFCYLFTLLTEFSKLFKWVLGWACCAYRCGETLSAPAQRERHAQLNVCCS